MSCLGPKNLVTKQEQKPTYDFVGDAKNGWKLGLYWRSFAVSTAFLFLLLFSRKINFRKHYAHDDIPLKYLPPSFEGNR